MPHFKCAACRTRLYSAARPADLIGDLCPSCGSLLDAVGDPAEVDGFRSIMPRDGAVDRVDDGGSFRAEAVSVPPPETEW